MLLPPCFCHSHNHCSCRYSRVDVVSILELQSLTVGNAVPIIHKEIYTVPGIGLRFLDFFLSTLEQRTNFLKLNA